MKMICKRGLCLLLTVILTAGLLSALTIGASALSLALANAERRMDRASPALAASLKLRLQSESSRVETLSERLRLLSPYGVLERGYSLTTASDGSVVRDAASLRKGDRLVTRLAKGSVESEVVASQT